MILFFSSHVSRSRLFLGASALLLVIALLPIPARSQASSTTGSQVQFPSSSAACVSCKPAFSSAACQGILNSIAESSTTPISNTTLAGCQCSSQFLSLYSSCVQCFTDTNQLALVFGSNQAPAQASLNAYCSSLSNPVNGAASGTVTTVTKTVTTTTSTSTSTSTSTHNPSAANALNVYGHEGQSLVGVLMYTAVAAVALVYFSVLS